MEMKRFAKRVLAIGTGALMLGATAMGALAADMKDYPTMFVKDGTYNGYLVIGENAKPIDTIAMTDIAVGMKYLKAAETSTTTLEGDNWLVGTGSMKYTMANSNASLSNVIGQGIYDIQTFIGEDELEALADGTYKNNNGDYSYTQSLYFDASNNANNEMVVYTQESNDDTIGDFFYVKSGANIGKYVLEFGSTASSDITDSTGATYSSGTATLWDFQNTKINMLGKEYTVVLAKRAAINKVKLTLMGGATSGTINEGEEQTVKLGTTDYKVKLLFTDSSSRAKFSVNGEQTNLLGVGDSYKLADGNEIGVSEVLYQNYAGGVHSSDFFLGASKIVLEDTAINDTLSDKSLVLGSDTMSDASVFIEGSDDNSTVKLSRITINMTAGDDYFVPVNGKLSDVIKANGDDKEVLFTNNWDMEYKGLSTEETHDIKIGASGDQKYKLTWYDGDGNKVDMPLAYANATTTVVIGEDSADKYLVFDESDTIQKNDYFVVTSGTASSGTAKSYLLQYKGADKTTSTESGKVKFKNMGSGENIELPVTTTGTINAIKLGGFSFNVVNASAVTNNDFNVNVTLDGGATLDGTQVNIIDYYGAQIALGALTNVTVTPAGRGAAYTNFTVTITTPNANDYAGTPFAPATILARVNSQTAASTSKVTLGTVTLDGVAAATGLVGPEDVDNIYYGYTSLGGKVTYTTPTTSLYEVTYAYPKDQVLPQLYVTSGAITASTTADGDWEAVTVVDATKFDSEVADYKAQNMIVIGGPCVNTVAAALLGNPADCTEGFTPGEARVKLFENGDKVAMLVAGYTGEDTRLAGKVVANRWKELTGSEVVVEGTTYTDATIGAPKVAAEVVAEPVAETPVTTE